MMDVISPDVPPALAQSMGQVETAFRRLTGLVQSLPPEALDYRGPDGAQNSAATLVTHLARTDLEYLYQIMGAAIPPDLLQAYGPYEDEAGRLPHISGQSVAQLLAHYSNVITMIRTYIQGLADADAARAVAVPWWPQPATVRYVLWHMALHSIHHQSQILRLKAQFSA
ncbi:MAG TPA: DinB family protein [Symbiobacteriaceae bacterium]|jgi:uncharacterized damage-inducible protein DinB|nr:DinB family protein [Symbiobacteriaceae bacterium]